MTPGEVLAHVDAGTLWPQVATFHTIDVPDAYQRALVVRAARIARGERPVGYKVGFTNRTIWDRYSVYGPIWGPMWNTTVTESDGAGSIDLARTCQPRIEPEACFGMASTPPADATLDQLFECVDWIAPSFEVVQSHKRDWVFTAAETVLDGALHARLLVGRRTPVRDIASNATVFDARLASTRVTLRRGSVDAPVVDTGTGANVLDGPLHALHHFVRELAACPGAPSLLPGEIVTTGTWTDAWPVVVGETWRSAYDDVLPGLVVSF